MQRKYFKLALGILMMTFSSILTVDAQTNLALTASVNQSGGGSNSTGYGPSNYNDNVIAACTGTTYGWVSSGGWIEYTWSASQTITSVRFLKGDRPMSSCTIQYWTGSAYATVVAYSNGTTCDHTVNFSAVTTTRLRFYNVTGASNPNHREIQVYGGLPCVNLPLVGSANTPTCSNQTISVGSGERRDFNVINGRNYSFTLSSCPSGWTMQLTGRNTSDTQLFQTSGTCNLTYNWTSNFTGVLRLNINRNSCQGFQGATYSSVLTYRQVPPSSGATTTWIGGSSGTNNWNVDSNWDNCIPNININANIPNVGQAPGITTSAAAKTLTIATGKVVTVACTNCLQIGP